MTKEIDFSLIRTPHFAIDEFINSSTAKSKGIDNTPDENAVFNIIAMMLWLEPARVFLGEPITVTSGYRSKELNSHPSIKGQPNSQHLTGEAADLVCKNLKKLFNILAEMDFDQLLFEHDSKGNQWIHVSHKAFGENRFYINDNYKA